MRRPGAAIHTIDTGRRDVSVAKPEIFFDMVPGADGKAKNMRLTAGPAEFCDIAPQRHFPTYFLGNEA